ncbi:hypothetical protein [Noviherbaspirillum suwonense]|nr:hypothetical protein [Noviherbaspirillum suwonense]
MSIDGLILTAAMENKDQTYSDNWDKQLASIREARSLRDLNEILTNSMARQTIHSLLKRDEDLRVTIDAITRLGEGTEEDSGLLAGAALGRLASVLGSAQSRAVIDAIPRVLARRPGAIDKLQGKEKYYASLSLQYVENPWVTDYCFNEAFAINTAENARKVLLQTAIGRSGDLASAWHAVTAAMVKQGVGTDGQLRRAADVSSIWLEVVRGWSGPIGPRPGAALSAWMAVLLNAARASTEEQLVFNIVDNALAMALRVVELRFSNAFVAETYQPLERAKSLVGRDQWSRYLGKSEVLLKIRQCVQESALVLARQNRTDKDIATALEVVFSSREQAARSMSAYFAELHDLDPEIRAWWVSVGAVQQVQREVNHQIGNGEDQQIGALLIEVEACKETMDKLERAVVPQLEISEPPLASTVKRAAVAYKDMARIATQLARMRRLSKTSLLDAVIEYNPLQHELLGGSRPGVRHVRIVREGIQKEFAGKIKTLVKPWVEPAND